MDGGSGAGMDMQVDLLDPEVNRPNLRMRTFLFEPSHGRIKGQNISTPI